MKKIRISQLYWAKWSGFVSSLQSFLVRSQLDICLLPSLRPGQSVDFGHISLTGRLHRLFELVLVDLNRVCHYLLSYSLYAQWSVWLWWWQSIQACFLEVGCSISVLGYPEVNDLQCFSFCLWIFLWPVFLAFSALALTILQGWGNSPHF